MKTIILEIDGKRHQLVEDTNLSTNCMHCSLYPDNCSGQNICYTISRSMGYHFKQEEEV